MLFTSVFLAIFGGWAIKASQDRVGEFLCMVTTDAPSDMPGIRLWLENTASGQSAYAKHVAGMLFAALGFGLIFAAGALFARAL